MDCVECAQGWLRQCTCGKEQRSVEGEQADGVEPLACACEQEVERQPGVRHDGPPDRAWHLGQDELARDEVGVGEEGAERSALGLVAKQSADESA